MPHTKPHAFTTYGCALCFWILVTSFQYGYHISSLNQIQAVLTCKITLLPEVTSGLPQYSLPTCIPMSDFAFSIITSVFTIGGLVGSLVANIFMDGRGRKGAVIASSILTAIGSAFMGVVSSVVLLSLGRLLIGIGAGIGLCVVPVFLAEIAPSRISGTVGVFTQLSIVFGIMITQIIGFKLATPTQWRHVLYISSLISLAQLGFAFMAVESPVWLGSNRRIEEKKQVSNKIWHYNDTNSSHDVEAPLLSGPDQRRNSDQQASYSVPQVLRSPDLRQPLFIISLAMVTQQISGVNAVLYYSNNILSKSLPSIAAYVSLGITVVNVLMTFPPIVLIEKLGRKTLLNLSLSGVCISLFAVGYGLNAAAVTLSSTAIISFIMSFAVGLGPVPFVMIPEVSPPHAVAALSSIALSLNWIVNFVVGLVFLPFRDFLAGGDSSKEGRIFYFFGVAMVICFFGLFKSYRG